jgi:hypothetical protein
VATILVCKLFSQLPVNTWLKQVRTRHIDPTDEQADIREADIAHAVFKQGEARINHNSAIRLMTKDDNKHFWD